MKVLWFGALMALLFAMTAIGVRPSASVEATPGGIVILNPDICMALYYGDFKCLNMTNPQNLEWFGNCDPAVEGIAICEVARGDLDGVLEPSDYAFIDLDADMAHDTDGSSFILAFVTGDAPVVLDTERGKWTSSLSATAACGSVVDLVAGNVDFSDEDCDGDGLKGDGVVVAQWYAGGPPAISRGANQIRVRQEATELTQVLTIVGEPVQLTLTTLETTVQPGILDIDGDGYLDHPDECPLPLEVSGFLTALDRPEKTVMIARVADSDGTQVTGSFLGFYSQDPGIAVLASTLSVSLDLGSYGIGAPDVICGTASTGPAWFWGCIITTISGLLIDPYAVQDCKWHQIAVVGPPAAISLTAVPAAIDCDGLASSTITATVTNHAGNPAVDGNEVNFSVQALGAASPLLAKTVGGVALSAITPLSAATAGVTVIVTSGAAQASIQVTCNPRTPTPTYTATATPTSTPSQTHTPQPASSGGGGSQPTRTATAAPLSTVAAATVIPPVPTRVMPAVGVITAPDTGDGNGAAASGGSQLPLGALAAVGLVLAGVGASNALARRRR